jgi:hypothetical protein
MKAKTLVYNLNEMKQKRYSESKSEFDDRISLAITKSHVLKVLVDDVMKTSESIQK